MKNDFIDVTGIEFQGEFGNDTCKGIEKPGKYIIRVIDNNWDDGKENYRKDPVWGPIVKKLESLKYGTPEYKEVEAQYNKLFVEKFGVDRYAWLPKEVDIVEIYQLEGDTSAIHTANRKWYIYNGSNRCFKPMSAAEAKQEYVDELKWNDNLKLIK